MTSTNEGFLETTTTDGRRFFLSVHHVIAVEKSAETIIHLHNGEKLAVTEVAEEFVRALSTAQSAHRPARLRRRARIRG